MSANLCPHGHTTGAEGMIKTPQQATLIQTRRVAAGKRGYAKAVRRFMAHKFEATYRAQMNHLPVVWTKTKNVAI